jgi:uncharacterized protein (UPF0332 family)
MMVDPGSLLALAQELAASDKETHFRCAASRAYYAGFHAARRALQRLGFAIRQGDQAHAAVRRRWSNSGNREWAKVGELLNDLRSERNVADYDLDKPFAARRADDAISDSDFVLTQLARSLTTEEQSKLVAEIRRYERDVLRDVTWRSAN